jgi:hypothetical protein
MNFEKNKWIFKFEQKIQIWTKFEKYSDFKI